MHVEQKVRHAELHAGNRTSKLSLDGAKPLTNTKTNSLFTKQCWNMNFNFLYPWWLINWNTFFFHIAAQRKSHFWGFRPTSVQVAKTLPLLKGNEGEEEEERKVATLGEEIVFALWISCVATSEYSWRIQLSSALNSSNLYPPPPKKNQTICHASETKAEEWKCSTQSELL